MEQRYDIFLMDADDTLFDYRAAEGNALNALFDDFRYPYSPQVHELYHQINDALWKEFERGNAEKKSLWTLRFDRLLAALGLAGDSCELNRVYLNHLGEQAVLLPGAEAVCAHLAGHVKLYITTNGIACVQRPRLERSGIQQYFSGLFISEEIGFPKPDPRYFSAVLHAIGNPDPARVLVVGDSLSSDIAGGIRSGLDTCWYNPSQTPCPPGVTPVYEISELKQLLSIKNNT